MRILRSSALHSHTHTLHHTTTTPSHSLTTAPHCSFSLLSPLTSSPLSPLCALRVCGAVCACVRVRVCVGKDSVKRSVVGIWTCRACKKQVAGGAYSLSTATAATVRSTIRRLREIKGV